MSLEGLIAPGVSAQALVLCIPERVQRVIADAVTLEWIYVLCVLDLSCSFLHKPGELTPSFPTSYFLLRPKLQSLSSPPPESPSIYGYSDPNVRMGRPSEM